MPFNNTQTLLNQHFSLPSVILANFSGNRRLLVDFDPFINLFFFEGLLTVVTMIKHQSSCVFWKVQQNVLVTFRY